MSLSSSIRAGGSTGSVRAVEGKPGADYEINSKKQNDYKDKSTENQLWPIIMNFLNESPFVNSIQGVFILFVYSFQSILPIYMALKIKNKRGSPIKEENNIKHKSNLPFFKFMCRVTFQHRVQPRGTCLLTARLLSPTSPTSATSPRATGCSRPGR